MVKIFDGTTDDLGGGQLKRNEAQEKAVQDAETLAKEEAEHEEQNFGLKVALRPIKTLIVMKVEIPEDIISEINTHIDDVIIPSQKSYASGLVGQLNQDERSAQWEFPMDDEVGSTLKQILDQVGTTYLRKGYGRDAKAEVFNCWTNHAYAGDSVSYTHLTMPTNREV